MENDWSKWTSIYTNLSNEEMESIVSKEVEIDYSHFNELWYRVNKIAKKENLKKTCVGKILYGKN